MPKDFRGQELEVGDRVVYVSSGRYTTRTIAEVVQVKNKVKIVPLQQDRDQGLYDPKLDPGSWVEPENCFAIDLFKNEIPLFARGGVVDELADEDHWIQRVHRDLAEGKLKPVTPDDLP